MSNWIVYEGKGDSGNIVYVSGDGGSRPHFSGLSSAAIRQGETFDLTAGVTAYDSEGNVIPFTVSPDTVDNCSVGTQVFTYTAEGIEATRRITVTQIANPTISIVGEIEVYVGQEFNPLDGVSAVDGNGNAITVTSDASNPMSYDAVGTYTITYTATDECGNTSTATRTANAVSGARIVGAVDATINQGTSFDLEDGVTAYDHEGNEVSFTVSPNTIDTCELGQQTFTYTSQYSTATRVITVANINAPIISGISQAINATRTETVNFMTGVSAVDGNGETVAVTSGERVFNDSINVNTTASPIGTIESLGVDDDVAIVISNAVVYNDGVAEQLGTIRTSATVTEYNNKLEISAPLPVDTGSVHITIDGTSASAYVGNYLGTFTRLTGNLTIIKEETSAAFYTTGTYTIAYVASDSCGNTTVKTRTVNVTSQARIEGATNTTSPQGVAFDLEEDVVAIDDFGVPTTFTVSPNTFDECALGAQTYTYTSADGVVVTRTITVTAIPDPTISGISQPIVVDVNEEFDPLTGVSAVDGNGNSVQVTATQTSQIMTASNVPIQRGVMTPIGTYQGNLDPGDTVLLVLENATVTIGGAIVDLNTPLTATAKLTSGDTPFMFENASSVSSLESFVITASANNNAFSAAITQMLEPTVYVINADVKLYK